ncbi:MAG: SPFH domain-containing protein [Oscillospiraceae bacterium]|nr:SPFH domain-containing protein [Oscillospiraceae bacterium]MBQ8917756.1 SPFH domain-containing protein [Oscillospiraceae bacterium]
MGIIKAVVGAVGGTLADQWLEVIESDQMSDTTVFAKGVAVRKNDKRSSNTKGTENLVTDGSVIHVYPNQFMLLVDGGKVIDYTAEEGYYTVKNESAPSLFNGQFGEALKETFERVKFGGVSPKAQQVFFINLQEIKGIKFGTPNAINYFDNFYNSELFLRTHGTYSIKITDPLLFYAEAIPRSASRVDINDINEQYLSEFLEALQAAVNQYSADGQRISFLASKGRELSKYMNDILDEEWKKNRGFEIQSVGIASISYDEESQKLINMRNQGAMLGDPSVREGYMQGAIARGLEAAGSNEGGSMAGFMGMGVGMNAAGGVVAAASNANQQQMAAQQPAAEGWTCACGAKCTGNFCPVCGKAKPQENTWTCACGAKCSGNFCPVCGQPKPASNEWTCPCGTKCTGNFCPTCGKAKPAN